MPVNLECAGHLEYASYTSMCCVLGVRSRKTQRLSTIASGHIMKHISELDHLERLVLPSLAHFIRFLAFNIDKDDANLSLRISAVLRARYIITVIDRHEMSLSYIRYTTPF
jgi:hypothetical protein